MRDRLPTSLAGADSPPWSHCEANVRTAVRGAGLLNFDRLWIGSGVFAGFAAVWENAKCAIVIP
jgi:hypothetical protein